MLDCLPPKSKCEWRKLQLLVENYNEKYRTNFALEECLDVKERNSPQPEVRLSDENIKKHMVIEHKSINWPPDRCKKHNVFHETCDQVCQGIGNEYNDDFFILDFGGEVDFDRKTQKALVKEITDSLLNQKKGIYAGKRIGSRKIFPWVFYKDDRDHKLGIVFNEHLFDLIEVEERELIPNYKNETQKALQRCISKLESYPNDLKLVALSYYSNCIYSNLELITKVINSIEIPQIVDQIWIEDQEWISEDESIANFVCVYCKNIDASEVEESNTL